MRGETRNSCDIFVKSWQHLCGSREWKGDGILSDEIPSVIVENNRHVSLYDSKPLWCNISGSYGTKYMGFIDIWLNGREAIWRSWDLECGRVGGWTALPSYRLIASPHFYVKRDEPLKDFKQFAATHLKFRSFILLTKYVKIWFYYDVRERF